MENQGTEQSKTISNSLAWGSKVREYGKSYYISLPKYIVGLLKLQNNQLLQAKYEDGKITFNVGA